MSDAWKDWERAIVAEARVYDLPWERRLRAGVHEDMLDIDNALPDGWLIGGKALGRHANMADRMSGAMLQCDRAIVSLGKKFPSLVDDTVPVQVLKRQGYPVSRAYAVMEFRYLLKLAVERRKWRGER